MKLTLAVLTAALGLSSAKKMSRKVKKNNVTPKSSISATSKMGGKLMSTARRLENANDDEVDYTWVANMSLKFQGCYHTQSWNDEADDEEDVRISTQRLVRFRLCPSDTCTMESAGGCDSGYGDYVIDMDSYLEAYFEAIEQDQEYSCEYEKEYGDCICDGENADDGFDEEICEYDCYMAKGMEYCVDNNPYNDDEEEEEEEMELREMAECRELEVEDDEDRKKRRLEEDEEEVAYYVGAYCSDSGSSIHLGVFTEETCSQFADDDGGRSTYYSLMAGKSLPYSDTTMIGTECMSCKEPADQDDNNGDDGEQDADEVKEGCEQLYEAAGKCEYGLDIQYPNNYGCNFMEGIKIVRKNGVIVRGAGSKNTTASVFIGLFAASFVLFGGYAYYLKTKLDRAKVNLVSEE
mmetsp:Transcript_29492/g.53497  ORF Transcript_29492/g.53497 Transcript_29492/m.53497 type:complete len:407 (+) Transcript_29492:103-1323(+)|eukprot:CAMPEP_0202008200 /NCGR_PEP_ID=MMETSP0905-20130828/12838_1 /ASSEMBLY_ACC=CAM_ASM_000554 /TAXON_ID=420261 /ORGANISM="Thalassiosira antarctica, Strain CCMP982" /LENGTH=406 /DNA_ID=CAMNT_0048566297 /DNA_START=74 /DNA_END=1294 /DNA_ORIENTATION=-